MLTHARLREVLHYDPATGVFTRLIAAGGNPIGAVAGTLSGPPHKRYCNIWVDGKSYHANRLAWFWMTGAFPAHQVDHKNLDRLDNRWENLREATPSQNTMNRRRFSGKTEPKGVYVRKNDRAVHKWRAIITKEGRRHNLGHFATCEEAQAAYAAAAHALHGEFARVA